MNHERGNHCTKKKKKEEKKKKKKKKEAALVSDDGWAGPTLEDVQGAGDGERQMERHHACEEIVERMQHTTLPNRARAHKLEAEEDSDQIPKEHLPGGKKHGAGGLEIDSAYERILIPASARRRTRTMCRRRRG